ncbi:ribosome biogenesis protein TSR3 isoform X1 [Aphis craccivora]|uniref:Ribosome biogenesis protein TSR3 isoform X1 n=1 Tax=Aphis craccivora TaxID=307492 RepID=A0A6G0YUI4_APHCR|nr:ribosome biogenesis protein TSR3 isoform X1 [Aphis craccivora]
MSDKSIYILFVLKINTPSFYYQEISIPISSEVKYLGIMLDKKFTLDPHIKSKRKILNSQTSLVLYLCKTIPKTYPASFPIHYYIHFISSAKWCVSNSTFQNDLKLATVNQLATEHYK